MKRSTRSTRTEPHTSHHNLMIAFPHGSRWHGCPKMNTTWVWSGVERQQNRSWMILWMILHPFTLKYSRFLVPVTKYHICSYVQVHRILKEFKSWHWHLKTLACKTKGALRRMGYLPWHNKTMWKSQADLFHSRGSLLWKCLGEKKRQWNKSCVKGKSPGLGPTGVDAEEYEVKGSVCSLFFKF